jgi:hypothetical protein
MFDLPVRRVWLIPAFGLSQYQRLNRFNHAFLVVAEVGKSRKQFGNFIFSQPAVTVQIRRLEADLDMPCSSGLSMV